MSFQSSHSTIPADPPIGYAFYPDEEEDVEQQDRLLSASSDARTPLDKTIDRIGMGTYQWALLSLCGFGWMADNMWIQAIAIILPRVQQHYSVPDNYVGILSSALFAGMMFGAVGWGTCSDVMGRSPAFNGTLFFTAVFGLMASFANSFTTLSVILFLLGSSVGGSMPTDGTLLLEHMPKNKQYLVTALSIFFSFGAVLSAFVALVILPKNSCSTIPCDVELDNKGWKYMLMTLGLITLFMFISRMIFFRLHESPRFLVHAGRPQDALNSLRLISLYNGSNLSIELEDVRDHHYAHIEESLFKGPSGVDSPGSETRARANSRTIFDARIIEDRSDNPASARSSIGSASGAPRPILTTTYSSTGETPVLNSYTFDTPVASSFPPIATPQYSHDTPPSSPSKATAVKPFDEALDLPVPRRRLSSVSRISSEHKRRIHRAIPRCVRKPLGAWWGRVSMVLAPEWLRTTILVWSAWYAMSLAYTMFNVFLPKLLETRLEPGKSQTLEESLWDVAIFTLGGCPGALLGAYFVESTLGRRWSLAGSTFVTALFCCVFALVTSTWAVRVSTIGISLSATAMWAVLYGWTPEIFGTKVRGTACGIASALSRIGGMIAPMLGGILLMMDRTVPVYTSVVIFAIAGFCVLLLREDAGDSVRESLNRY